MKKVKKFEEFDKPVDLVVHTKCPDKWLVGLIILQVMMMY